ncbi:hypothetical protein BDFB_006248 [Asbolus verrucosus]|uniref:Uncharacterized protein n=1 Tax=Asbolus verrucosus TaxID=1661398 RepID=A0A482VCL0_ASBVE|nr:hypothetical protein BDFB_006248 [Asbolus verrucosus]
MKTRILALAILLIIYM